jgi:MOSC domain-containing protein YiiM
MKTLEQVPRAGCVEICRLYVSAGHNFFGHHGKPPGQNPMLEVEEIQCVAGRGICGDRFFDHQENYKGQITFFAREVYEALCEKLGTWEKSLAVFRRNTITSGVDLNDLIGEEFEIRGVRFRGAEECRPCYWMDQAFGPGAFDFLKGRGGLRAQILSTGILRTINE